MRGVRSVDPEGRAVISAYFAGLRARLGLPARLGVAALAVVLAFALAWFGSALPIEAVLIVIVAVVAAAAGFPLGVGTALLAASPTTSVTRRTGPTAWPAVSSSLSPAPWSARFLWRDGDHRGTWRRRTRATRLPRRVACRASPRRRSRKWGHRDQPRRPCLRHSRSLARRLHQEHRRQRCGASRFSHRAEQVDLRNARVLEPVAQQRRAISAMPAAICAIRHRRRSPSSKAPRSRKASSMKAFRSNRASSTKRRARSQR